MEALKQHDQDQARLMNNPITMSCSQIDLEKQIVLRANRLIGVLSVKCLRGSVLSVGFANRMTLLIQPTGERSH